MRNIVSSDSETYESPATRWTREQFGTTGGRFLILIAVILIGRGLLPPVRHRTLFDVVLLSEIGRDLSWSPQIALLGSMLVFAGLYAFGVRPRWGLVAGLAASAIGTWCLSLRDSAFGFVAGGWIAETARTLVLAGVAALAIGALRRRWLLLAPTLLLLGPRFGDALSPYVFGPLVPEQGRLLLFLLGLTVLAIGAFVGTAELRDEDFASSVEPVVRRNRPLTIGMVAKGLGLLVLVHLAGGVLGLLTISDVERSSGVGRIESTFELIGRPLLAIGLPLAILVGALIWVARRPTSSAPEVDDQPAGSGIGMAVTATATIAAVVLLASWAFAPIRTWSPMIEDRLATLLLGLVSLRFALAASPRARLAAAFAPALVTQVMTLLVAWVMTGLVVRHVTIFSGPTLANTLVAGSIAGGILAILFLPFPGQRSDGPDQDFYASEV